MLYIIYINMRCKNPSYPQQIDAMMDNYNNPQRLVDSLLFKYCIMNI